MRPAIRIPNAAKLQERWTRLDQYNLEATVTVDDPKYYTKPFQLMKTDYYWKKDQDVRRGALSGVVGDRVSRQAGQPVWLGRRSQTAELKIM